MMHSLLSIHFNSFQQLTSTFIHILDVRLDIISFIYSPTDVLLSCLKKYIKI